MNSENKESIKVLIGKLLSLKTFIKGHMKVSVQPIDMKFYLENQSVWNSLKVWEL